MAKKRYMVMESDGEQVTGVYPVRKVVGYLDGKVLEYKRDGKLSLCYLGSKVRPLLWKNKYWIGREIGNSSACQVVSRKVVVDDVELEVEEGFELLGEPCDSDMPGEDLSSVVKSDILNKFAGTVGKKRNYVLAIIIIVVVVIGIVAVIMYARSRGIGV